MPEMTRPIAHPSAIELLERLVAFDTTSARSNLELIGFVRDYLAGYGVESRIIPYQDGAKANLFATIGNPESAGIVFSGHTDVVPAKAGEWQSDPFALTRRGDRLYGRGSADMKGFVAVVLAAVPEFLARAHARPIHIALSCDEEVGCGGVKPMIRHIAQNHPLPLAVVVGEPTLMQVVNATKGVATYVSEVTGQEAHSSDPRRGVNAIALAGHVLIELERLGERLKAKGDPTGCFDPPYATLNVGVIAGGTVKNVVPRQCDITWEIRFPAGIDLAAPLAQMQKFGDALQARAQSATAGCRVSTREIRCVSALAPDNGSYAEALVLGALRANRAVSASYATEAGLFQEAGMPTVICGPGSIEQAHKPDEYIEIGELESCANFLRRLLAAWSA
jgi:acetylornithine deacetylase